MTSDELDDWFVTAIFVVCWVVLIASSGCGCQLKTKWSQYQHGPVLVGTKPDPKTAADGDD
jgi:hypothetical protein